MRATLGPWSRRARTRASRCLVLGILAVAAPTAGAQVVPGGAGRANATRAELTALAAQTDAAAAAAKSARERGRKLRDAAAIRHRLSHGDFEAGDRIVVVVSGDSALTDTVIVTARRTIQLAKLPPLALDTILRSELHAHLARSIGRFLRDTLFHAIPLIRFGVLGEVASPGYYRLAADASISDALMVAGGPTSTADVPGTVVRRGSRKVMSKRAVREAMVAGATLDQLGLGAGDEIVVAVRRERGWAFATQIAAVATGVLVSLRALR